MNGGGKVIWLAPTEKDFCLAIAILSKITFYIVARPLEKPFKSELVDFHEAKPQ